MRLTFFIVSVLASSLEKPTESASTHMNLQPAEDIEEIPVSLQYHPRHNQVRLMSVSAWIAMSEAAEGRVLKGGRPSIDTGSSTDAVESSSEDEGEYEKVNLDSADEYSGDAYHESTFKDSEKRDAAKEKRSNENSDKYANETQQSD